MISLKKKDSESNESLMRRFSRKVQSTGVLNRVKKAQFFTKKPKKRAVRLAAIRKTELAQEREYLRKIGKLDEYMDKHGKGKNKKKPLPKINSTK